MATRYSGDLTIRVQWIDKAHTGPHGGYYRCTISRGKNHLWSGAINAAQHITDGVDSSASYDSTARAALAFADHEGADVESAAYAADLSDRWVGRSKKTAWPNEPSQRNMSGSTRNYEYVVYEETDHASPQHKVTGFGKSALREAVMLAKIFHKRKGGQPAIYGITYGGWVGYINHNGMYQGTGTQWGKLR